MEDLTEFLNMFDQNVEKAQQLLFAFKRDVDTERQSLLESGSHGTRADQRIISEHNELLSSVSKVNTYLMQTNLLLNLSRAEINLKYQESLKLSNSHTENHTNLDGIQVLPLKDIKLASATEEPYELSLIEIKPASEIRSAGKAAVPKLPIQPRKSDLLPPNGGKGMTFNKTYKTLFKNMSQYSNDSIVNAIIMHVNLLDNYFVVAKWESIALQQLLACNLPVEELHQLPDFGEVFGVYLEQEKIITRALIHGYSGNNGYSAYLLDYGEDIHMNGDEVIFKIPEDVAALPAEGIRCYLSNKEIKFASQFLYKEVRLQILNNNGYNLVVELLEDESIDSDSKQETPREEDTPKDVNDDKPASSPKKLNQSNAKKLKDQDQGCKNKLVSSPKQDQEQPPKIDQESIKSNTKLSPTDLTMLEDGGQCTSDVVEAVLGFNPKDDHDPKYGESFEGSNCQKLHQSLASDGATNDIELTETSPEIQLKSFATRELGSSVRVLVTYICSPTKVYVHFVADDDSSPLMWSKDDVPESERIFKRAPLPLDIVLALYSDGYYSRAQIIENNDGMFKIFYVDYGNTELVTIKSLAICNNARSLKPHRAVCCFIHGIQLSPMNSPIKAIECVEYLKSKLLNVELNVKLICRIPDDSYAIKFLDHHADILSQIMDDGYVEPRTANWKDIC